MTATTEWAEMMSDVLYFGQLVQYFEGRDVAHRRTSDLVWLGEEGRRYRAAVYFDVIQDTPVRVGVFAVQGTTDEYDATIQPIFEGPTAHLRSDGRNQTEFVQALSEAVAAADQ